MSRSGSSRRLGMAGREAAGGCHFFQEMRSCGSDEIPTAACWDQLRPLALSCMAQTPKLRRMRLPLLTAAVYVTVRVLPAVPAQRGKARLFCLESGRAGETGVRACVARVALKFLAAILDPPPTTDWQSNPPSNATPVPQSPRSRYQLMPSLTRHPAVWAAAWCPHEPHGPPGLRGI